MKRVQPLECRLEYLDNDLYLVFKDHATAEEAAALFEVVGLQPSMNCVGGYYNALRLTYIEILHV
jgi:hypothetical protein